MFHFKTCHFSFFLYITIKNEYKYILFFVYIFQFFLLKQVPVLSHCSFVYTEAIDVNRALLLRAQGWELFCRQDPEATLSDASPTSTSDQTRNYMTSPHNLLCRKFPSFPKPSLKAEVLQSNSLTWLASLLRNKLHFECKELFPGNGRELQVPRTSFYSIKLPAQEEVFSKSAGTVRAGLVVLNTSDWSSTHGFISATIRKNLKQQTRLFFFVVHCASINQHGFSE